QPRPVALGDITDGRAGENEHVVVAAEPLRANAIRIVKNKGDVGLRLVPVRNTADRVWLALPGDDWDGPVADGKYAGRLRALDALPLAGVARDYAAETPRLELVKPTDATAATIKAASGDTIAPADGDRVAYDVIEPAAALITASIVPRYPNEKAWLAAFAIASITDVTAEKPREIDEAFGQLRFDAKLSP